MTRQIIKTAFRNIRILLSTVFSRIFWKDRIVLWSLGIAIFSVLILTALMYFNVPETDLPLILHYSIYRGVDFLGQSSKIFSLPLIILALMIINTIIADFFYKKEKIISYLFMIALPLIAFFLLLAGINLILINR